MTEKIEKMISACGLDCAQCESYKATQANDQAAIAVLVEKWRKEYDSPGISAENILCDGCLGGKRTLGYCRECKIRACVFDRGLKNCASCPEFGCEMTKAFWERAPQARTNLEALRAGK